MRELVFHRTFLPAIDRWASKVGFHDGDYHATFAQHGERVLRLADAMHTTLGLERGDRFAVMSANSHQYLELERPPGDRVGAGGDADLPHTSTSLANRS